MTEFSNYDFLKKSRLVTFVCNNWIEPSILEASKSTVKTLNLESNAKLIFAFPKATKVCLARRYKEVVGDLQPLVEELFVWDSCTDDVIQSIEESIETQINVKMD